MVGSSVWVPTRNTADGMALIDVGRRLRHRLPIRGVFIGDGSGIDMLKTRCREYGIADRVEFPGRIPYDELPGWLRQFDICLSTQTDDVIGWVRTTGKLPLYLAAGRFILASRVGEAARVLPPEMLVEFRGPVDPAYPARLAERVVELGPRRLLSIGHSYVVAGNRRLAHAVQRAAGRRWEVHVAAPDYFHGGRDLRPVALSAAGAEPCPLVALPARLTRSVHLFSYGRGLRALLRSGWDVVHAW